jgi:hypothetical protein
MRARRSVSPHEAVALLSSGVRGVMMRHGPNHPLCRVGRHRRIMGHVTGNNRKRQNWRPRTYPRPDQVPSPRGVSLSSIGMPR